MVRLQKPESKYYLKRESLYDIYIYIYTYIALSHVTLFLPLKHQEKDRGRCFMLDTKFLRERERIYLDDWVQSSSWTFFNSIEGKWKTCNTPRQRYMQQRKQVICMYIDISLHICKQYDNVSTI